jgi:hypothetical protein
MVLTSKLADLVRTLTKTALRVGQPYRCAMIHYSSMIFCPSQQRTHLSGTACMARMIKVTRIPYRKTRSHHHS